MKASGATPVLKVGLPSGAGASGAVLGTGSGISDAGHLH